MIRLLVSPAADADLRGHCRYIAQHNESAAARLAIRVDARYELVQHSPELGERIPQLGPYTRRTLIEPYVIYYDFRGNLVEILRVLHGAREMPGAFYANPLE
jgi:toxin ParE1/3/4